MYRRILVPLDGSERAEQALLHACHLARSSGAELLLVHVVEPPVVAAPVGEPAAKSAAPQLISLEDALKQAQLEARAYLEKIRSQLEDAGIPCQVRLEQGGVVERIADAAETQGVDAIVMASHGRGASGDASFGSVAVGILFRVESALLVIRSRRGP